MPTAPLSGPDPTAPADDALRDIDADIDADGDAEQTIDSHSQPTKEASTHALSHAHAHAHAHDVDTQDAKSTAKDDGALSLPLDDDPAQLAPHRSRLPTFFYLLSFAPPFASTALTSPRAFFAHPYTLYAIGTAAALAAGVSTPSVDMLYGYWSNGITAPDATPGQILGRSEQVGWIMTVCGIAALCLNWLFLTCFSLAAHDLTVRMRHTYVASVLVQDQVFFDLVGPGEIASRAGKDVATIRVGLGEKMAYLISSLSLTVTGIVSSLIYLPRLGGFLFSLVPFTVAVFAVLGWASDVVGAPALAVEGRAASLLEQILSSVRIVQAFGMAPALVRRLERGMLAKIQRLGLGRAVIRGVGQSAIYFVLNTTYSIAFWYGSICIANYGADIGSVLVAFWNVLQSIFGLANAVPHLSGIYEAYTALALLRRQIERQPRIDVRHQGGLKNSPSSGSEDGGDAPAFELRNITFAYPSRPKTRSLKDVSVSVESGKVTAFVGPSGSGKSTIAALLLREYDPETCNWRNPADPLPEEEQEDNDKSVEGGGDAEKPKPFATWLSKRRASTKEEQPSTENASALELARTRSVKEDKTATLPRVVGSGNVFYRGANLRDYNLRWLRSQIAVVSQHPQLTTASIFENVAAGLTGTQWALHPDVDLDPSADAATKARTDIIREKCTEALKKSLAWDFVAKLPKGIDTVITGGRTSLLSGGQRQRVAIARALVRQPLVLILDEATSALDSATEDRIKLMLEEEQRKRGMTLVLIAHRLSTIAQADKIVVLARGQVLDQGTFEELVAPERPDHTFREMALSQHAAVAGEDGDQVQHPIRPSSSQSRGAPCPSTTLSAGSEAVTPSHSSLQPHRPRAAPLQDSQSMAARLLRPSFTGRGCMAAGQADHTVTSPSGTVAGGDALSLLTSRASRDEEAVSTSQGPQTQSGTREKSISSRNSYAGTDEKPRSGAGVGGDADSPASPASPHAPRSRWSVILRKLFSVLGEQKWFYLIGVAGALVGGGSFPVAGWMTGHGVDSLSIAGDNERMRSESTHWATYFFVLACADLVIFLINAFFLELASEATVRKLKVDGLGALLRQEIGFFDHEDSASGALTSAVSSHPANVGAATGLILSQVLLSIANLVGSVILGLVLSWKASLVCLAPLFVLFVCGFAEVSLLEKYETLSAKPAAAAGAYIAEAVDTVRTLSALGREYETMRAFDSAARSDPQRTKFLMFGALGFATGQAMVLFLSALAFYWGGKVLSQGDIGIASLYAVFEAVIIGAFAASRLFTYIGDYSRALSSFSTLESWLGRQPRIAKIEPQWQPGAAERAGVGPPAASGGEKTVAPVPAAPFAQHPTSGDIVFTNVEMRYPQRPHHPALNCVNLTIKAGTHVAFCGTSGSGKSSILALLQRFYDPSRGTITYGGVDSRAIDPTELRRGMAYVSQDPVLFEGTLRWNLSLGCEGGDTDSDYDVAEGEGEGAGAPGLGPPTDAELERALDEACILDFVRTTLPQGLDTELGMKGAQLSGGQKQRLCIARALLRGSPRGTAPILCLDEATSALDPTSEKAVQRALDRASRTGGRTTISIAHRLSTIRGADVIHVVEDGAIVESGSHDELIARKGRYFDLVAAQI